LERHDKKILKLKNLDSITNGSDGSLVPIRRVEFVTKKRIKRKKKSWVINAGWTISWGRRGNVGKKKPIAIKSDGRLSFLKCRRDQGERDGNPGREGGTKVDKGNATANRVSFSVR